MIRVEILKRTTLMLALFTALFPVASLAFVIPTNDGFVTDTADIIDDTQEEQLESYLREFKQKTDIVVALVTVRSIAANVDINESSDLILQKWRVGSADNEEGMVMLYSYGDRRLGVSLTPTLLDQLPAETIDQVIQADVVPQIRDGQYSQGFASAIDSFYKHITGDYTNDRYKDVKTKSPITSVILFIISLVFITIAAYYSKDSEWWFGAFAGCIMGFIFIAFQRWWLGVPLLTLLGVLFDFILTEHKGERTRSRRRRRPRSL